MWVVGHALRNNVWMHFLTGELLEKTTKSHVGGGDKEVVKSSLEIPLMVEGRHPSTGSWAANDICGGGGDLSNPTS